MRKAAPYPPNLIAPLPPQGRGVGGEGSQRNDHHWMSQALHLANQAFQHGEIPVGAVIINEGICIGAGYNQVKTQHDPCAHAEILAIRQACQTLGYERLPEATLYVTLEPCVMCAGALLQARIKRVVFGTRDFRAGAIGSKMNVTNAIALYPTISVDEGIQQTECSTILQIFFSQIVRNKDQAE